MMNSIPAQLPAYEAEYHENRHKDHSNSLYYKARARVALNKFFYDTDRNARLLDFGCGLGQNIFYLPNAEGYDISNYSVQFCQEKGIRATVDLDSILDESFDVVFSAHVLEHHPYPLEMLTDIRQKLRKGQKLILVLPHERHGRADFKLDLNQHLYMWNFRTINNLLITAGFEVQENRYVRGAGYNKLLPLAKLSFKLYYMATNLLSRICGIKEMMIVAVKK